jgi:hypothetical protein
LQGQSELQRIRDKNDQMAAQLEALQSSMVQETQQRIIAQKTADRLRNDLRNREAVLQESARRIKQTEEMLSHREKIIGALKDKHQPESQIWKPSRYLHLGLRSFGSWSPREHPQKR